MIVSNPSAALPTISTVMTRKAITLVTSPELQPSRWNTVAVASVVSRPIADFDAYADQLNRFVFRSGFIMKPLFAKARAARKRVIYS